MCLPRQSLSRSDGDVASAERQDRRVEPQRSITPEDSDAVLVGLSRVQEVAVLDVAGELTVALRRDEFACYSVDLLDHASSGETRLMGVRAESEGKPADLREDTAA